MARHFQQQSTVGENKLDSSGERNQVVDRTYIEESVQLCHKASLHLVSSRSKEKQKTKEHVTSRNGDRYQKNEQQLDRMSKKSSGQCGLKNVGWRPMLQRG